MAKKIKEKPFLLNYMQIKYFDWITYLSQLKDGRLISCSTDGSVKIYSKEHFDVDLIIEGQFGEVNSFTELNDGRLIICYDEATMKVIKLLGEKSYKVEQSLDEHSDFVYKIIEVKKNKFVSISKDKSMRIWELKDNNEFKYIKRIIYQNKNSSSNILKINDNEFATSSFGNDWNISFWNSNNYTLIKRFEIQTYWSRKNMCLLDDDTLCVGGANGFYLIKITLHELVKSNFIGLNVLSIIKCNDGTFLCGIEDNEKNNSIIKYKYDGHNLRQIKEKKNAHENHILSLVELNDGTVVSGGKDGILKFW